MTRVRLGVGIAGNGDAIYTLRVGDRIARFDEAEAEQLLRDWPGRVGAEAALSAANGEAFTFTIGGKALRLSAPESQELAGFNLRLRALKEVAERIQAGGDGRPQITSALASSAVKGAVGAARRSSKSDEQ